MMTERDFDYSPAASELSICTNEVYKPWSATPSGSAFDNPLVKKRLEEIEASELKMVEYGYNNPDLASMADIVYDAYVMRSQTRRTKASFSNTDLLYPCVEMPEDLLERDEIGAANQHELMYLMKKRGMKSKELGKITHLYGVSGMEHVESMYRETMNYLNDLETLSFALNDGCLSSLEEDDFQYIDDVETLEMMVETLSKEDGSFGQIEIMDTPDYSYYRVASRDWTAPLGESNIVMLKRKQRLGKIDGSEIVMRTSFIVNLDELSSRVDSDVLDNVRNLEYDENWAEEILSKRVGLVDEIDRLGLTDDPYSFILVSTTIYAKDSGVEAAINKMHQEEKDSNKRWNQVLQQFV